MCASFVLFFYYLYWYLISRFWWASISRGSIFTSFNSQIWKRTLRFSISRSRVFQKVWPYWKKTKQKKKTRLEQAMCETGRGRGSYFPSHNLQSNQQGSCQLTYVLIMRITSKIIDRQFSISYPEFSGLLVSAATPGRLWGHQFNRFFWLAMPFLTEVEYQINFCILIGSWVGA